MEAQKCPVCEGSGEYIKNKISKKCHGCDGKGWIIVPLTPLIVDKYKLRFSETPKEYLLLSKDEHTF